MIEPRDLTRYLPINTAIPEVNLYQGHHVWHLEKCLESSLFSSAYFHAHLIYILFIYLQLFRISQIREEEFKYSLIGFPQYERDLLKENRDPFSFCQIHEKTIFRFFRLIDIDDGTITNVSGCVNQRNNHLHVNGELVCDSEDKMEKILNEYQKNMEQIFLKSKHFVEEVYLRRLSDLPKETDIELSSDDIELNIFIPGLLSYRELDFIKTLRSQDIYTKYLVQNY